MQASGWIQLIRRIPPQLFDKLVLTTSNGTELSLQSVVRIEGEFLIVRARLSGSSDAGRAFFIPFDQINFLSFQKPIKEDQLRAMFDGPEAWPTAAAGAAPAQEVLGEQSAAPPLSWEPAATEEVPVPEEPAPEPPPPAAPAGPRSAQQLPTKSKVLANLRARLRPGGSSPGVR